MESWKRYALILQRNNPIWNDLGVCITTTPPYLVIHQCFPGKFNIHCISHPAYSPDLAPCDFWLFPGLRKTLSSHRFRTVQEVKTVVQTHFLMLTSTEYVNTILTKWEARWQLCIQNEGRYFEKTSKAPLTTARAKIIYFVTYQLIFNTPFEFLEGSFQLVFIKRA